jgi:hypothetical protein
MQGLEVARAAPRLGFLNYLPHVHYGLLFPCDTYAVTCTLQGNVVSRSKL